MKHALYLLFTFLSINTFGQIVIKNIKGNNETNRWLQSDTIVRVEYGNMKDHGQKMRLYLNGEIQNTSLLTGIDPKVIDTSFLKGINFFLYTKNKYSPK